MIQVGTLVHRVEYGSLQEEASMKLAMQSELHTVRTFVLLVVILGLVSQVALFAAYCWVERAERRRIPPTRVLPRKEVILP
jgi:hypothetical protein